MSLLRQLAPEDVEAARPRALDPDVHAAACAIVDDVGARGEPALRAYAARYDGLPDDAPLFLGPSELARASASLDPESLALLERTAARIRAFAEAQRATLSALDTPVPGGRAGHDLVPLERVGCYAPGGRYPLPSSVLMTAIPARVAGVEEVWVACPDPAPSVLAAAHVAGATGVLRAGGAQAIAALARGAGRLAPCDLVCGPGNAWVTAAKQRVSGEVAIDGLAGPSELLIVADAAADPALVAADLLAQAEHDSDARPMLVALDPGLLPSVDAQLEGQLEDLPTADVARAALSAGFAVMAASPDEAVALIDRVAPEHLQLVGDVPPTLAPRVRHAGALFLGERGAEVLGDYGAGPNHVLPTGAGARHRGGLSVLDFVRVRTWLELDEAPLSHALARDAAALARLEGLEGHARAADLRADRLG